jgi:nicotinamidase-related amidase
MKPAVIVIDMVKEALDESNTEPLTSFARAIVPAINRLTAEARKRSIPVIFSTDSFLEGDFIFKGKMKERSIRGTEGAEVTDLLFQAPTDIWLPKRRFSAFFKTDLDQTLRLYGVDTVAVAGITTHWCVLSTVLDALANDFAAFFIEDGCASHKAEIHENILNCFRRNPLDPLFQVMTVDEFLQKLD